MVEGYKISGYSDGRGPGITVESKTHLKWVIITRNMVYVKDLAEGLLPISRTHFPEIREMLTHDKLSLLEITESMVADYNIIIEYLRDLCYIYDVDESLYDCMYDRHTIEVRLRGTDLIIVHNIDGNTLTLHNRVFCYVWYVRNTYPRDLMCVLGNYARILGISQPLKHTDRIAHDRLAGQSRY